jgi:hypothetical protein
MRLRFAVALALVSGCYSELSLGVTRAIGPKAESGFNLYLMVGEGFNLDTAGPARVGVGTSLQVAHVDTDEGFAAALALGLSLQGDVRIAQASPRTQYRLSGRVTVWDLASQIDVDPTGPANDFDASNPLVHDGFLGFTWAVFCDGPPGCGEISIGTVATLVYSDETDWLLLVGPAVRVVGVYTFFEKLKRADKE